MNEFEKYIKLATEQFPDADIRRYGRTNVAVEFPETGWGIDIIYGFGSYGFDDGLIKLAVLKNGHLHYENPVAQDDVRGNLTADEALRFTKKVSEWAYDQNFSEEDWNDPVYLDDDWDLKLKKVRGNFAHASYHDEPGWMKGDNNE